MCQSHDSLQKLTASLRVMDTFWCSEVRVYTHGWIPRWQMVHPSNATDTKWLKGFMLVTGLFQDFDFASVELYGLRSVIHVRAEGLQKAFTRSHQRVKVLKRKMKNCKKRPYWKKTLIYNCHFKVLKFCKIFYIFDYRKYAVA